MELRACPMIMYKTICLRCRAEEVDEDNEEIPAKKARYESDHGSDEDFADKLLEGI